MSDEELDEALAELAETRATAERELEALQGRREAVEELERERDALLDSYAQMVPEQLDLLTPEERHQVYKMHRLRVSTYQDGTLEVSGVFGDSFVSENQHEGVLVTQDQLPVTRSVVALDEGVSSPPQVAQGELFAPRSREPVVQPTTPA